MVSLAELLRDGDVLWSGHATNINEFEFRPTKGTLPSKIKAWLRSKITSLETKWVHMEETHGKTAWEKLACAVDSVLSKAKTALAKNGVFTSGREKAGNDPNYVTKANVCKKFILYYLFI
jgi:hypothetical protein